MKIKIGERVEIISDRSIHHSGGTIVKLDGNTVGAIQSIDMCFSSEQPYTALKCTVVEFDTPGTDAHTRQMEFVAEMARNGFDIKWAHLHDLPEVKLDMSEINKPGWINGQDPIWLLRRSVKK